MEKYDSKLSRESTMEYVAKFYTELTGKQIDTDFRCEANALTAYLKERTRGKRHEAIDVVDMQGVQRISITLPTQQAATRLYRLLEDEALAINPELDTEFPAKQAADILWQTRAVKVVLPGEDYYKVDKGKNRSPYYINTRILTGPKRKCYYDIIASNAAALIEERFKPDIVAGVAISGIPFADSTTDKLHLPMIWVRSKAKYKGGPLIEGARLSEIVGKKVLVENDVIAQGSSTSHAIKVLQDCGAIVDDCLAIVDRQEGGKETLLRLGVELTSITNHDYIFDGALEKKYVDIAQWGQVQSHHKNAADWHDELGLKYHKIDSKADAPPLCLHKRR